MVGVDSPHAYGTEKWATYRNGFEFPWDVDEGLRGNIQPEDVLVGVDSPHLRANGTNSDCRKTPWNLRETSLYGIPGTPNCYLAVESEHILTSVYPPNGRAIYGDLGELSSDLHEARAIVYVNILIGVDSPGEAAVCGDLAELPWNLDKPCLARIDSKNISIGVYPPNGRAIHSNLCQISRYVLKRLTVEFEDVLGEGAIDPPNRGRARGRGPNRDAG